MGMKINMNKKIFAVGTITVNDKVHVSDPCYELGTWCSGSVNNMLPGKYECFITISAEGQWGERVSDIEIRHVDYLECDATTKMPFVIGVDSATCGIYDFDYFTQYAGDDIWAWKVMNITSNPVQGSVYGGKCIVASSGYGDGAYDCYIGRIPNKKVVAVRIRFI